MTRDHESVPQARSCVHLTSRDLTAINVQHVGTC